jgi:ABC-2 type transport system permease protein
MREFNAIIVIAFRDVMKFLRDRPRILATFIFPFIFISVLGGSLQSNLGGEVGFNFLTFVFTGIIAQTLFQSAAGGIISLVEDRENDFSQEMFVSPVSRYSIIIGKIVGESVVAYLQVIGVIVFGLIIRVPIDFSRLLLLIPAGAVVCLLGGAFGVLVMSQLNNQRSANQIFPFLLFPQFFLAGVFTPVKNLPLYLLVLSRISPMTYGVDLVRGIYYSGRPEFNRLVIFNPFINLAIVGALFLVMLTVGTYFFVRNERNR